ncbi:MAG TPA: hypothetical protein VIF08_07470 [Candidatus Limnocylindrales bacterium]|jgi:hypothetical protein
MAKKEKPPAGPDDLVRAGAGAYTSGDGRFAVQKSDQRWFLVDNEQSNEFGQQLIHGPFDTLEDVRAAIPGAREIKPLLRVPRRVTPAPAKSGTGRGGKSSATQKAASRKPPTPMSWIDRLPAREAAEVRRLIAVLEAEGISSAESVVKRDRDSEGFALIAEEIIARRLAKVVAGATPAARDELRRAVRRVAEILTDEGGATARPLPRWELVETPRDPGQPPRRIRPRVGP